MCSSEQHSQAVEWNHVCSVMHIRWLSKAYDKTWIGHTWIHWSLNKVADISQTAFSNVCSWNIYIFWHFFFFFIFCLNNKSSLVKVMAGCQTIGFIAKKFSQKYMFHPLKWRHNERLKSSAPRLFTQSCVQAHIKENIKVSCHWPLGIPRTKGQYRGKCVHLITS